MKVTEFGKEIRTATLVVSGGGDRPVEGTAVYGKTRGGWCLMETTGGLGEYSGVLADTNRAKRLIEYQGWTANWEGKD